MHDSTPESRPCVSITLLVKNTGPRLRDLLDTLVQQQAPFPFEIVAVDSGSTDGSRELLERYRVRLICIPPEHFDFGPTRDLAFEQARGRYIVALSDDAIPVDEHWLEKLVAPLEQGYDVAQGIAIPPADRRVFYWDPVFHYTREGRGFFRRYGGLGLSGVAMVMTRAAWERTRFGDAVMSEDKAIQKRLFEAGYRMTFAEGAMVYHGHNYTLRSLMWRCETEGYGWRAVGVSYTVPQLLVDLCHPRLWLRWVRGLWRGDLRTSADLLFILVRPLWLFKGNHLTSAEQVRRGYHGRYRRDRG